MLTILWFSQAPTTAFNRNPFRNNNIPQESIQSCWAAHVLALGTNVQATSDAAQQKTSSWILVRVQGGTLKCVITIEVILYKYSRQWTHVCMSLVTNTANKPVLFRSTPLVCQRTLSVVKLGLLVAARKLATSWEILLWMTPSEAPKALQASECSELLDPMRASCWISAQH